MPLPNFLRNISIAKKISLGFSALLLFIVVAVSVATLGISAVIEDFSDLVQHELTAARHISNVKIALLEARRPEKDLLYADDPTLINASSSFSAKLIDEAKSAEKVLTGHLDDSKIDEIKAIANDGAEYRNLFATMVSTPVGQDRMLAAVALRKTAKALEAKIDHSLEVINGQISTETHEAGKRSSSTIGTAVGVGVVSLLVGILLAVSISGSITQPLSAMRNTIVEVQRSGDFSQRVAYTNDDEVGTTAQAFNMLMTELQKTIGEVQQSSVAIADAARSLAAAANRVTDGSKSQSEAASSVAAAMEETSVSISEAASNAGHANEQAIRTKTGVDGALLSMRNTVANVNGVANLIRAAGENISRLDDSSKQIGGIVQVIQEIADQTNLLALNAAIEAARAGEQGRGFAVVADEVRKLAERTTASTHEISVLIEEIQTRVDAAVSGIKEANAQTDHGLMLVEASQTAIHHIEGDTKQVAGNVNSISDAMREQDAAVHQVTNNVENIVQLAEHNTAAAQSAADSATHLDELADRLRNSVARFNI